MFPSYVMALRLESLTYQPLLPKACRRPRPILGTPAKTGGNRVPFDVFDDPQDFRLIAGPMIVRLVLPEDVPWCRPSSPLISWAVYPLIPWVTFSNSQVGISRAWTWLAMMHQAYTSMLPYRTKWSLDDLRRPRILQVQRAGLRLIQQPVAPGEDQLFLPQFPGPGRLPPAGRLFFQAFPSPPEVSGPRPAAPRLSGSTSERSENPSGISCGRRRSVASLAGHNP